VRILINEGYYVWHDPFSQQLGRGRHHLWFTSDGQLLLEALLTEPSFDLIVTSNRAHGMYGIEALRLMRENEKYKNLPVVMFTSDDSVEEEAEALSAVYVRKNYGVLGVIDAVKTRLDIDL
jgi:CheY-like chemotaxis protein